MNSNFDFSAFFMKAFALYKAYFYQLIIFGIASALLANMVDLIPFSSEGSEIIKVFLSLILVFVQIKITVSLIVFIRHLLSGNLIDPTTALKESSQYYWNYVATSILLGFRMVLIVVPLVVVANLFQHWFAYVILVIIGIIGLGYILIHYSFAPLMRVLNPEVNTPFASTYELVKGHRLEVLSFTIIIGVLSSAMVLVYTYLPLPFPVGIILNVAYSALVLPLVNVLLVLFYDYLVDQVPENQVLLEDD